MPTNHRCADADTQPQTGAKTKVREHCLLLIALACGLALAACGAENANDAMPQGDQAQSDGGAEQFELPADITAEELEIALNAMGVEATVDADHARAVVSNEALAPDGAIRPAILAALKRLNDVSDEVSLVNGIDEAAMTDSTIASIIQIPPFKGIAIDFDASPNVTEECLEVFASCDSPFVLALWGERIQNNWMSSLAKCKKLNVLYLLSASITDVGVEIVATIKSLEELNLWCSLTDQGVRSLARLPLLREADFTVTTLTGEGFDAWSEMTALESLGLHYYVGDQECPFNDAGLAAISAISSLKELEFDTHEYSHPPTARTTFTEEGMLALGNLSKLERLRISSFTDLTDAGFACLEGMPALQELELTELGPGFTGAGLAHLRNADSLTSIDVSFGVGINDELFTHLPHLPALETLILRECPNITETGLRQLREARPDVEIITD